MANERQGCRNCRRRRIICDKTLPKCFKCGTRSLECPGYGPNYRWKSTAYDQTRVKTEVEALDLIQELSGQASMHQLSSSLVQTMTSDRGAEYTPQPKVMPAPLFNASHLSSLPGYINNSLFSRLLHHYVMVITPELDWVDTAENVHRSIIPSMGFKIPSICFALLALSAGDLSTRMKLNDLDSHNYTNIQQRLQEDALTLLSTHLQALTASFEPKGPLNKSQLREMLVSVFLLVCLGVRLGRNQIWELHLRAARALIDSWNAADGIVSHAGYGVERCIIQLLGEFQTWLSIMTFGQSPRITLKRGPGDWHAPFDGYVHALDQITILARRRLRQVPIDTAMEVDRLLKELEDTKKTTLEYSLQIPFNAANARSAFSSLVEMFHQATLIYLFRAGLDHETATRACTAPKLRLFQVLRGLPDIETIAHNMPWPLFIAGTECHGCVESQKFVEAKMHEMIRLTGTLDRHRMLKFLHEVWTSEEMCEGVNWISIAQRWDWQGNAFLVQ
ncbi:hypothetical protein PV10_03383 [Exophiala mesophila]|uniref:Zn(2)-C6 fungal-type domain-containing protein n=1 Tax=Exophiala mesophila TaxID=212818 RepID=A0A0D2A9X4_EXOME|nr:uncharacterized protein PV10_03383 [Exophiala mesophila]KIV95768.1 hypothetical protein PV10_03383 [Exophiala mesophila]